VFFMKIKIKTYLLVRNYYGHLQHFNADCHAKSGCAFPMFDSGAPSPRIIPGICLVGMLICSVILVIQSLVFKKDKEMEF